MVRTARHSEGTRILAALFGWAFAAGCGGDAIVFPDGEPAPFVYLVLNETTAPAGRPVQPAFLLTIVSGDSAAFRTAERFEMRRLSDAGVFYWKNESLFGLVPFEQASELQLVQGNYLLADSASERGLGFQDLEPGATYQLLIETNGEIVRGRTTIPDTFSISIVRRFDSVTAVWPSVAGAAGYAVTATGDEVFRAVVQTDTTFRLQPRSNFVEVIALDANAFRYLVSDDTRRAGIDNGFGVFGAIQIARR